MRPTSRRQIRAVCAMASLLLALAARPAAAERLVSSLSNHIVQITSNFTGVELTLFGTVENGQAAALHNRYDIVATVTGPRESMVVLHKERIFGIWMNAQSRTFVDVPAFLEVLSTRPFASFADAEMLRRERIGIADTPLPQQLGPRVTDASPDDPFRQSFVRIKQERHLYGETTNGVTFLTPTLYRATIFVPAEAPVGTYDVDIKLFAGGAVIARTNSAFEIVTVGFERFIASAAVDHGLAYGVVTAMMAVMTGWLASVIFRRD
ncbi:MAG TPA: TIGR02186 family protein [Xanthobacteraceae bacterium]|nr:TIGR02186 family protein [Xanthobacteraceae bacterium]